MLTKALPSSNLPIIEPKNFSENTSLTTTSLVGLGALAALGCCYVLWNIFKRDSLPTLNLLVKQDIKAFLKAQKTQPSNQQIVKCTPAIVIPHVLIGSFKDVSKRQFAYILCLSSQEVKIDEARTHIDLDERQPKCFLTDIKSLPQFLENFSKKSYQSIFKAIDQARLLEEDFFIYCEGDDNAGMLILAAYLITKMEISAEDALHFIQAQRSDLSPINPCHLKSLQEYAKNVSAK